MEALCKEAIWGQLGAAIDALDATIEACSDEHWEAGPAWESRWYLVHHTVFWLDLHLSGREEGFAPPAPFGREELDPAGVLPPRSYSRCELRAYLAHCRAKAREAIDGLTEVRAAERCRFGWGESSYLELLLYTTRHVQHAVGQMNLAMRQYGGTAAPWVVRAKEEGNV